MRSLPGKSKFGIYDDPEHMLTYLVQSRALCFQEDGAKQDMCMSLGMFALYRVFAIYILAYVQLMHSCGPLGGLLDTCATACETIA